jgi:hypothetical protein
MAMKFYVTLFAVTILLPSCFKKSIADAMLNSAKGETATLSYEINGTPVTISVKDADNGLGGYYTLSCQKSNGYNLNGISNYGEFTFTFYTDSLKAGNYKYTSLYYSGMYITDFQGQPCYIAEATDNMNFTITSYKDGRINGNFTGQITPAVMQGPYGNVYGASGSVVIKNGTFSNVPVVY